MHIRCNPLQSQAHSPALQQCRTTPEVSLRLANANISVDEARIRPHLRPGSYELYAAQSKTLGDTLASGTTKTPPANTSSSAMANPGDLRGIPCIAKGVSGTQPHTQPEQETVYRLTPRRQP